MKGHLILMIALVACTSKQSSQGEGFLSKVNQTNIQDNSESLTFFDNEKKPLSSAFTSFSSGSIKPKGWILEMMKNDLEKGMVGALDELYPGIKSDNLYNDHRRGGLDDVPEMGDLVLTGAEWEKSIMWWNAETTGNWWDGFIRHAFLTNNKKAIEQSHEIVSNLIESQDEDGYIGIYKPNLRYQHEGSNGELWAQTTAFRSLLGYYEFTDDKKVLEAVKKGMEVTMNFYNDEAKNPFELKNAFGGVTHGLMLTDVCELLHRITGKQKYQDYAVYLYKAFSTFSINRAFNDFRYPFLTQKDSMFTGHAVHTYEHIRTLINAYYQTGYPELKEAYENSLMKLDRCILPSGAGHGNEWILGLDADPTTTASEYCSMLELRNSLGSMIQKTGDITFADAAEKLTYNAMLGARDYDGKAITYSKPDNCYVLDGRHHEEGKLHEDPRYKYSPTHSEPAVCCAPNYGRNLPYFLDQMWMKAQDGIAMVMYGPSQLRTEIDGSKIVIEQITNYPLSDEVTIRVNSDSPANFALYLRKPLWSSNMNVSGAEGTEEDSFLVIRKKWENEEELRVTFKNEVKLIKAFNSETYVQKGPVVYAYEIPFRKEIVKSYSDEEFKDYYCFPLNEEYKKVQLPEKFNYIESSTGTTGSSFYDLTAQLTGLNSLNQEVKLVPMGKTILRKVTFSDN